MRLAQQAPWHPLRLSPQVPRGCKGQGKSTERRLINAKAEDTTTKNTIKLLIESLFYTYTFSGGAAAGADIKRDVELV